MSTASNWNDATVHEYEQMIPIKIPGYYTLYNMIGNFLSSMLAGKLKSPHILIAGAGGGQEILTLGKKDATLQFTGIDPSQSMLQLAKQRIRNNDIQNEVTLINGTVHELQDDERFNAATCILVLHFIRNTSEKRDLIMQIQQRLKPGAPFFICAINGNPNSNSFSVQMKAWRNHMRQNHVPKEDWERFESSFGTDIHPITEKEMITLLQDCGFTIITRFFTSFLIDGFWAIKR